MSATVSTSSSFRRSALHDVAKSADGAGVADVRLKAMALISSGVDEPDDVSVSAALMPKRGKRARDGGRRPANVLGAPWAMSCRNAAT